jgi:uncharacterized SAM-binding protein YcdF (DUF218 family)
MGRSVLRRRVLAAFGAFSIAYLGLAVWLDQRGQREPPAARFDAIVVLGCRVQPNGTPSGSLERRARHGAALYHRGLASRLVLTGGIGTYPPSEAASAASVAREEGVPDGAMILEERSTSTEENAREAARLLGSDARVLVVTDAYHAFRAERVFRRYFDSVVATGTIAHPARTRVWGALREVSALSAYAVLGRL